MEFNIHTTLGMESSIYTPEGKVLLGVCNIILVTRRSTVSTIERGVYLSYSQHTDALLGEHFFNAALETRVLNKFLKSCKYLGVLLGQIQATFI
jgi:hypothetical protein